MSILDLGSAGIPCYKGDGPAPQESKKRVTALISPMSLAVGGAIAFLIIPALVVLIWQHRGWRRTEERLNDTRDQLAAMGAALDASPDGYFSWLDSENDTGQCSRRLAVLLDLYRGADASFEDILSGFDQDSEDLLKKVG